MKIHRSTGYVHIDLSGAEAAVLLEELETVRGGSKHPKIRQVCEGLATTLAIGPRAPDRPRGGQPRLQIVPQVAAMQEWQSEDEKP